MIQQRYHWVKLIYCSSLARGYLYNYACINQLYMYCTCSCSADINLALSSAFDKYIVSLYWAVATMTTTG